VNAQEIERDRLAKLVEELMAAEKPGRSTLMLAIAARAVRRGRLLTADEQMNNLLNAIDAEEPPTRLKAV
jgi:hypothetical protein